MNSRSSTPVRRCAGWREAHLPVWDKTRTKQRAPLQGPLAWHPSSHLGGAPGCCYFYIRPLASPPLRKMATIYVLAALTNHRQPVRTPARSPASRRGRLTVLCTEPSALSSGTGGGRKVGASPQFAARGLA